MKYLIASKISLYNTMTSKSMNESRVSLVNDGSVGSNTQKIIQQKDKRLQQKR